MVQISRVCPVLGTSVTVTVDDDRDLTTVICPYHERDSRACRLRTRSTSGGPLSELVEHDARGRFVSGAERCLLN